MREFSIPSLSVLSETAIPASPSVVKGVKGRLCDRILPLQPEGCQQREVLVSLEETQSGRCPRLVQSKGLVKEQYKGRLAAAERSNGTYTVILNQLTDRTPASTVRQADGDHELDVHSAAQGCRVRLNLGKREGRQLRDLSQPQHHPQPSASASPLQAAGEPTRSSHNQHPSPTCSATNKHPFLPQTLQPPHIATPVIKSISFFDSLYGIS